MKSTILFGSLICFVLAVSSCSKDDSSPAVVLKNITLTYDLSFPQANGYTATVQKIDSAAICEAFGKLTYTQFKTLLSSKDTVNVIKYTAVKPDGTIDATAPTANGNGHWFDANGSVISWGATAMVYSEYQDVNFAFNIGCHPDNSKAGTTYTIKQGFIYKKDASTSVLATLIFNITLN